MILETLEADIKQLHLLIGYHDSIAADAQLYNRPSEGALEVLTAKYLQELKGINEGVSNSSNNQSN